MRVVSVEHRGVGRAVDREDRAVPAAPRSRRTARRRAVLDLGVELDAVIEIEVARRRRIAARSSSGRRRRRIRCGSPASTASGRSRASGSHRRRAAASDRTAPSPALDQRSGTPRSMVATRRVASASRGVIPFQMPQMFSQLSQPTPLKKAYCRSSVLLRLQRSEMLTMWRGSSHLKRSTVGTNVNSYWPQDMTFQASGLVVRDAFGLEGERMCRSRRPRGRTPAARRPACRR